MRNLDNGVDSLEDAHRGQNAGRKLDPTVEWLDSLADDPEVRYRERVIRVKKK